MSVINQESRLQQDDFYIRKSDLDDIQLINNMISSEYSHQINELYNNPNVLSLFEKSFVSFTILNASQTVIGAACFDDFPMGLTGKYDDKHHNLWEDWIGKAFNLEGVAVSSSNALWMNFFCVSDEYKNRVEQVFERLLQNLYIIQPQLDGVLFLKRGEVEMFEQHESSYQIIRGHFIEFKATDREVLKQLIGISYKSQLFYSPKYHSLEYMQIRMAKEEDHDDLAEIFNKQSEVLTSQFGEFFIADLIATQNLTRRMTKDSSSEGKAIVGQVGDKAIGLMSVSTQIDYNLLNQCFDIGTFNKLIKEELLDAITARYDQIRHMQAMQKQRDHRKTLKLIQQQRIKLLKIGQRIVLQQFCIEKQSEIKLQLENIANNQTQLKALDIPGFQNLLKKWTAGFEVYLPSEIFLKYPEYAKDLQSFILSSSQFLIETLEIFGLPKNYMKKEGHWKDWAKKIIEENIAAQLRRPKKNTKKVPLKKGKNDKKEEDNLKPPDYFDISPFTQAFTRFVSINTQMRALFREEVNLKEKIIRMLFCDKDGQMVLEKNIDLTTLGKEMSQKGIALPAQINDNMHCFLEAFGGIKYYQKVIQVQEKIEEKRNVNLKKQQEPKLVNVTQRLVSYNDFELALKQIGIFDVELARLGYLQSPKIDEEVRELEQREAAEEEKIEAAHAREFNFGKYKGLVQNLNLNELPEIPFEAYNAIVINLFCIDELYEARSQDFIQFAFGLFPDRDYLIITQPFTVPESSLVKNFIQVPRVKNSTFEHCLYIYHKDFLYAKQIKVRKSEPEDIPKARPLLAQIYSQDQIEKNIVDSITKSSSQYQSFSVYCLGELIGMYTVSKNVNLDYYTSHFFVQDQMIISEHPRDKHGKIIYSFINPLFIKSVRFILKQVLRLTNKTCLYFEVHNRTLLPDIFNEFTPLRMRIFPHFLKKKWNFSYQAQDLERNLKDKGGMDNQRCAHDQQQAPFSLSVITKKDLSTYKVNNNTRIVIVGASDTGISFIQSLLMLKQVNFTNIFLLSPGGVITMHVKNQADLLKAASTSYTLQELKNLMIDARTTVLDAKMVKLDKKQKKILIDKNASIPYDILVLSVGLIDTLLQNQGLVSSGLKNSPFYKDKNFVDGVYSIDDPYLYQSFAHGSKNISLLKRKKKPQNITIYGRTPHTIAFISGLLARGVAPERIYYVSPSSIRRRTYKFQSNQDRIQYESQLINDPDTFQDLNVEKIVIDHMRHIGVNVELGFEFYEMDGNPLNGIMFRKKADNYEELQEQIKKKRQQIEAALQDPGKGLDDNMYDDSDDEQEKLTPEQQIQILQQKQWKQLYTPSSIFITSGLIDIDKEIFNIIHQNGLVYNGRLIVKSNFQTTEREIFACGKICEFSQRYKNFSVGKSLRLDRYNGRELGSILGKHVLELMNLSYLTTETYSQDELPKFHMSVGMGSALPQDMVYYYTKRTDTALPKLVYEKGVNSDELISKNIKDFKGHYIKFGIDANGMIESVSYLGSEQVVVPSLNSFVGLHIDYLNKIIKRNDSGLIPDIAEFLSENWAISLYHELFSEFRHYMKKYVSSKPIAERLNNRAVEKAQDGKFAESEFMKQIRDLVPEAIRQEIREGTISFIENNKNHLPMYYMPKQR